MTPFNLLQDITRALQSDGGSITDPGSGGTIRTLLRGYGVCRVRTNAAESRALDDANNLVAGQLLLVILESDGGDLTLTGAGNGSVVLQQEGQSVLFFAGKKASTGAVVWWAINPQSGAYGYGINIKAAPFSAAGDGTTDDSTAIAAAVAAAQVLGTVVIAPEGTYKIASDVTMREVAVDFSLATISVSGTATKLIIGGNANHATNPTQKFYKIQRSGGVNSNPTCRMAGSKGQTVVIDYCDYLELYANTNSDVITTDSSIAYCSFHLAKVDKLVITNNASTNGTSVQWVNQNIFYMNRTSTLIVEGTYHHNGNWFYGGDFENAAVVTLTTGHDNIIFGGRFEFVSGTPPAVTFGSGTFANRILVGFGSNNQLQYSEATSTTVSDSGLGNVYMPMTRLGQTRLPIVVVNDRTCQSFSNATGTGRANFTTLRGVDVQRRNVDNFQRANSALVFDCPLIPMVPGESIHFTADANNFRAIVKVYNSSRVQLLDADSISSMMVTKTGLNYDSVNSRWVSSTNIGTAGTYAIVASSSVAFVKFEIDSGTANIAFREFALHKLTFDVSALQQSHSWQQSPRNPAITTATPVRGFAAEIGMKISVTTGGFCTATTAVDTSVATTVASGTTLIVTTATGATGFGSMAIGDVISIALDDGTPLWTTIANRVGTTITLTDAVPSTATAGARVTTNAWAAS